MQGLTELFSSDQWLLLMGAFIGFAASISLFLEKKSLFSIIALTASALLLYSFVALLDPFLHIWDERFHALVAKNLLDHPLLPTLYDDPVVEMAYDRWDRSVVWLHKQPLFLWQIMVSFKIWGINEFGLRFPSVIMATLLVPMAFRVGKLLIDEMVGYTAAVLILSSFYMIQIVSGVQSTDHNDMAFLFYVSSSIWAWVEYEYSASYVKWRWAILVGLLSGAAILCKWLVGLLVYAAFGSQLFVGFKKQRLAHITIAFLVTLFVSVPWQLLSFSWYPAEAALELEYNALHFSDVIEGHREEFWYHVNKIPTLFGEGANWLIIPGMLFLIGRSKKRSVAVFMVLLIVIVYSFYTLATTKMQSYPFVVALPVYISLAALIGSVLKTIQDNLSSLSKFVFAILIAALAYHHINPKMLLKEHTSYYEHNEYHEGLAKNRLFFLDLKDKIPTNSVLFNVSGRHYVEAMFYTGFPSYEMVPTQKELGQVERANMKSIILDDGRTEIPSAIMKDSRVNIIQYRIHSYH